MKRSFRLLPLQAAVVIMSAALLFPLACMGEEGLEVLHAPAIHYPVRYGVSPPLRDITPLPPQAGPPREIPLRAIPHVPSVSITEDPVLQALSGPPLSTTSPLNFDGVSDAAQSTVSGYLVAPSDTNGVVGATQYVQWVNLAYQVFNKDGTAALGPIPGNALWINLGGACATNNSGDPIVQYDKAANRWVMTQPVFSGPPYYQCVAVSQTPDATGTYNLYAYQFSNFNDYPKLGVWPDAYYMSFNMFQGNSFVGAQACALDRDSMLKGLAAPAMQCFQLSSSYASLLPADLDGATAPPAGSPNYFLNFGSNSLNLWKFSVVWGSSPSASFIGPDNFGVASFTEACNGGGACIPQQGTSQRLDSLGDRLMYRLAYRNFGGHESLVVNHSVAAESVVGIRWYELRAPFTKTNTNVLYQQATYVGSPPDANYRWMGSIAMDRLGDIALGYSVSSGSMHPAIRYTGRTSSDTLGTLGSETSIIEGSGSQTRNLSRWGDYSSLTIDPMDDCTFWYTNEYLNSSGTFNWSTRIASFRLSSCPAATFYAILGTVTATGGAPLPGVTMTLGGAGSGTATTDQYGNYSFTGLTNGTYTVTPSATGYTFSPLSASVTISGGSVIQNFSAIVPPAAPTNLSATAGNAQVFLTWTASSGATSYNVLRSTTSGSGYSQIATGVTTTSYADTSVANGTTYYYVVQAVNGAGTSGNSNEANATPQASATYSISGAVTKTRGAPLSGVAMTLSGAGTGTTTTDSNGNYNFAGLVNGTYTVTPSATGYRFSPSSRNVTISGTNVTGVNFKGK